MMEMKTSIYFVYQQDVDLDRLYLYMILCFLFNRVDDKASSVWASPFVLFEWNHLKGT